MRTFAYLLSVLLAYALPIASAYMFFRYLRERRKEQARQAEAARLAAWGEWGRERAKKEPVRAFGEWQRIERPPPAVYDALRDAILLAEEGWDHMTPTYKAKMDYEARIGRLWNVLKPGAQA